MLREQPTVLCCSLRMDSRRKEEKWPPKNNLAADGGGCSERCRVEFLERGREKPEPCVPRDTERIKVKVRKCRQTVSPEEIRKVTTNKI